MSTKEITAPSLRRNTASAPPLETSPAGVATLDDIAAALGIHKSTVSVALSGNKPVSARTRERVRAMASELGYHPNPAAQRLAVGSKNSVVCLFSAGADVGQSAIKVLRIQEALASRGVEAPNYSMPKWAPARDLAEVQVAQIRQICRQRPRAVVCATSMVVPGVFAELETYQRAGGIVVSYDQPIPLDCDQVVYDREDNAYQVVRHLLEIGHRQIRMAVSHQWWRETVAKSVVETHPVAPRARGFLRALREFDLPTEDVWLFRDTGYEPGGAEIARQFLDLKERPTAVAVVNDYVAMAFMVEIMRAGVRVPEGVSIAGHDNQPVAAYCPVPLTTGTNPVDLIAQTVVEMLSERIDGYAGPSRTTLLKGELILRGSTSAPQSL